MSLGWLFLVYLSGALTIMGVLAAIIRWDNKRNGVKW